MCSNIFITMFPYRSLGKCVYIAGFMVRQSGNLDLFTKFLISLINNMQFVIGMSLKTLNAFVPIFPLADRVSFKCKSVAANRWH